MTLAELNLIRYFLSKLVVRGADEEALINLVERIDSILASRAA